MAILKRLDYVIKQTSSNQISAQQTAVVSDLNTKQTDTSNILDSNPIIYYYATLFDPRNKKSFYVFSDATKTQFGLSEGVIDISGSSTSGAVIDDTTTTTDKVYSSKKTEEQIKTATATIKQDVGAQVSISFLETL